MWRSYQVFLGNASTELLKPANFIKSFVHLQVSLIWFYRVQIRIKNFITVLPFTFKVVDVSRYMWRYNNKRDSRKLFVVWYGFYAWYLYRHCTDQLENRRELSDETYLLWIPSHDCLSQVCLIVMVDTVSVYMLLRCRCSDLDRSNSSSIHSSGYTISVFHTLPENKAMQSI